MSVLGELRQLWFDKLPRGANPTMDPTAVPPFVLVGPVRSVNPTDDNRTFCTYAGELTVYAVVPPPGDARALERLERLVDIVVATFGPTAFDLDLYAAVGDRPCPGYRFTYPVSIDLDPVED